MPGPPLPGDGGRTVGPSRVLPLGGARQERGLAIYGTDHRLQEAAPLEFVG